MLLINLGGNFFYNCSLPGPSDGYVTALSSGQIWCVPLLFLEVRSVFFLRVVSFVSFYGWAEIVKIVVTSGSLFNQ